MKTYVINVDTSRTPGAQSLSRLVDGHILLLIGGRGVVTLIENGPYPIRTIKKLLLKCQVIIIINMLMPASMIVLHI